MTNNPRQSAAFLKGQLRPVPPVSKKRLAQLIKDLDSERFPIRRRAQGELAKFGPLAKAALIKALANRPSTEASRQIKDLLKKLETSVLSADTVRTLRAIEV